MTTPDNGCLKFLSPLLVFAVMALCVDWKLAHVVPFDSLCIAGSGWTCIKDFPNGPTHIKFVGPPVPAECAFVYLTDAWDAELNYLK